MASTSHNDLDGLNGQIAVLKDLHGQLDRLRTLPKSLVRGAGVQLDVLHVTRSNSLDEPTQKALANGEKDADGVQISRTSSKKRTKSPEPYVRDIKPKTTLFPEHAACPDLRTFLVEWNGMHPRCRAAFWRSRRQDRTSEDVLVVRIADVMIAYVMVAEDGIVDAITVFGPRETGGGPFSSSVYSVFREVGERVSGLLSISSVAVPGVLPLLESYTELFSRPCSVCGRVLSASAAPVDRIWSQKAGWQSKHTTCR